MLLLFAVVVHADTLWLRDGRRIDGQLVSIRDGVIDFDVQRGFFGRDRMRVERAEVARIDLDGTNRPADRFDNGGGSGSSDTARQGRPSGMRERDVSVRADAAWQDAGISVRQGQTLYFVASGRVRWGPGRQDGPQGERSSPRNDARPMPGRPAAALIGRIGDDNDFFFIGDDDGPIRVRGGGRLFLRINDDMLGDNSGAFSVTVYY